MSDIGMRVIVVGGFLGSGKTTLLAQAARHFAAQGRRVGIITNDQAPLLVDTQFLASLNVTVGEVAGGCFCCRFEDLENAASRLFKDTRPDILLTEPVGSCTDISATVLQPIKQLWGTWAELAPFSVLADPRRLRQTLDQDSGFPASVRYIIRKQFEEADWVVINKTDLISPRELADLEARAASLWSGIGILQMSALHDRGVAEWLSTILGATGAGSRILDVDYDTYARGEAELGWLNTSLTLTAREETDWNAFALKLIRMIQTELANRFAEIGHLKLLIANSTGQVVANAVSSLDTPTIRGKIAAGPGTVDLVLNARAHEDPDDLKAIVERSIAAAARDAVEVSSAGLCSFSPAYPKPTHRFEKVVQS